MVRKKKTAAALAAVSMVRLLTWQSAPPDTPNPFPLQLGFDMLKYRERDRENGCLRGTLFRRGISHVQDEWLVPYCVWIVRLFSLAYLWDNHELRGLMISPVCETHLCWSGLPSCLSPPKVLKSLLCLTFSLPHSVTLSGRQFPPPPAAVSMCWSLSPSPFILCVVVEWLKTKENQTLAQIWEEQSGKERGKGESQWKNKKIKNQGKEQRQKTRFGPGSVGQSVQSCAGGGGGF